MQIDLSPDLVAMISDLKTSFDDLRAELSAVRSELKAIPAAPSTPRASYSTEEVAKLLGKSEYTCREWCRQGRIRATKREERRGGFAIWSISASEVERLKNEGLLPPDPKRNCG